jgi:hypothetical protein
VYEGHTWGCFMNDARLANAHVKLILSKIRPVPGGIPSHYERVSVLHLSSVQISKESQADLAAVLKMDKCPIRVLDLSNTQLDVPALVKSLETNSTLRSLDVRKVPGTALEPRARPERRSYLTRAVAGGCPPRRSP